MNNKDFIIPKFDNTKDVEIANPIHGSAQDMCCISSTCKRECERYGDLCMFDSEREESKSAYKNWAKSNFKQWIKK